MVPNSRYLVFDNELKTKDESSNGNRYNGINGQVLHIYKEELFQGNVIGDNSYMKCIEERENVNIKIIFIKMA
jgi:hypothetical protein